MPKKFNDVYVQKAVINYILSKLPPDQIYRPLPGHGKLQGILEEAKEKIFPQGHTRTLRKWWEYFLKNGECQAAVEKREAYLRKRYKSAGRRGQWDEGRTQALKEIVDSFPELYLDEIQEMFYHKTREFWSQSTLWKKLRTEVNYSLQVATDRATQRQQEHIDSYFEDLHAFVYDPNQLVFVDETAKDRNSSRRRRCWSRRGQTPFRPAYLAHRHTLRYTFIGACDINGFILESCDTVEREHGNNDPDPSRGTVDGNRFRIWVEEKLIPVLGNYSRGEPRSIVVLDNASIHHVEGIVEMIEDAGAKVIFTAPYCPEYNPIETMFHIYKSNLKRLSHDMPWNEAHILAIKSVTPEKARALFRRSKVPYCQHFNTLVLTEEQKLVVAVACAVVVKKLRNRKRKRNS